MGIEIDWSKNRRMSKIFKLSAMLTSGWEVAGMVGHN